MGGVAYLSGVSPKSSVIELISVGDIENAVFSSFVEDAGEMLMSLALMVPLISVVDHNWRNFGRCKLDGRVGRDWLGFRILLVDCIR